MINTVRNTVLSVLNKNNYGNISPSDFNLYAKLAQLEIFDNYFSQYNNQINQENVRMSGTEYADIRKGIEENIDNFSSFNGLVVSSGSTYLLPSQATTGDDYYLLNKALIYQTLITEGTNDSVAGGTSQLIDSTADFSTGIAVGDIIAVESGGVQYVTVVTIDSATEITTTGTPWSGTGLSYAIYSSTSKFEEAERVSHSKITMLVNSLMTPPTLTYPSYTQDANSIVLYPSTITSVGQVKMQYIRYPREPKWTYITLSNGEPVFDASASDYQDFEVALDDESNLVMKILQYAGVSIREIEAYQFAQAEEQEDKQQ